MSTNQREPELDQESDQETFIPFSEYLERPPITTISPTISPAKTVVANLEEEFNKLCKQQPKSSRLGIKRGIVWRKREPLRFYQSLAFVLTSERLPYVAVSSFINTGGVSQLYIASNQTIPESEQKEMTEIINLFLEMKPAKEISAKVIPRQLSYFTKQFRKISPVQRDDFFEIYPGELSALVKTLSNFEKEYLTSDDIYPLLKLIWENLKELRLMRDGDLKSSTKRTMKLAGHLCKMARVFEEINYVFKQVKRHQQDKSLKSLSSSFQFIENESQCHAEIALLKAAVEQCASASLYIGTSKRPCYCCSLFFKAVNESNKLKFNSTIVTTHGKLLRKWNKVEGFMEEEFNKVWKQVVEEERNVNKPREDYYYSVFGSSSDEDDPRPRRK